MHPHFAGGCNGDLTHRYYLLTTATVNPTFSFSTVEYGVPGAGRLLLVYVGTSKRAVLRRSGSWCSRKTLKKKFKDGQLFGLSIRCAVFSRLEEPIIKKGRKKENRGCAACNKISQRFMRWPEAELGWNIAEIETGWR